MADPEVNVFPLSCDLSVPFSLFPSFSDELGLALNHMVPPNGYNLGRDYFIGNVTNQTSPIEPYNVTNTTTFSGSTVWDNYTYSTNVKYVSGLLQNSSININHNDSVMQDGQPAIDGLVAVLTVYITDTPSSAITMANILPLTSLFALVVASSMSIML